MKAKRNKNVFEIGIAKSENKKHPTKFYDPFTGRFLPKSIVKEYIPEIIEISPEEKLVEAFESWSEGNLEDYTDEDYIPFANAFTLQFPSWKSYDFAQLQKAAFNWFNKNEFTSPEKMLRSQTYLLANTIALRRKK